MFCGTFFGRFGVPKQIVSDNGPQFTSEQFQAFVRNNGIQHKTSVPWHPATNGLAERFVQSFKLAMKSAASDSGSLHQKIGNFLLVYRNSPHSTTNESPAKLFLGRSIRSRLDLVKPSVKDAVQKKQFDSLTDSKRPQFNVGDNVMIRDYRENSDKWTSAKISEKTDHFHTKFKLGRRETGVAMQIKWYRHGLSRNPQNRFRTYPWTPVPKRKFRQIVVRNLKLLKDGTQQGTESLLTDSLISERNCKYSVY